jgi:hypothetical protein
MEPEDEDFYVKEFGGYKPVKQSVPVASIRPLITPIIGGETPEEARAKRQEEAYRAAQEERAKAQLGISSAQLGLSFEDQEMQRRAQQQSLSKEQFDRVSKLRTEFQAIPDVKDFIGIKNSTRQIVELAKGEGSPMGEIASVFLIMKALDPASVVREGEFATVQNATSIPGRFANYYNKILKGQGLSQEQREDMARTALSIYNQRKLGYDEFAGTYRNLLEKEGANPDEQGVTAAPVLEFQPKPPPGEGKKTGEEAKPVAAGEEAQPTFMLPQPGQLVQTEADKVVEAAYQKAWDENRSVDEIIALAKSLGRGGPEGPFDAAAIKRMREARAKGKQIKIRAAPTGEQTVIQEAMATDIGKKLGGAAVGTVTGLTLGAAKDIIPGFGDVEAAYGQEVPVSTAIGQTAGLIGAGLPISNVAKAALPARFAGTTPLIGETLAAGTFGYNVAPEGQELQNAAISAGAAGLTGALANRFLPGPGTFSGMARPAAAPDTFAGPPLTPQQLVEAGREANIPIMTSDVNPPQSYGGKVAQQVIEMLPLGPSGARISQQEQRTQAVKSLLNDAGVTIDDDIASNIVKDLTATRQAELTKWNDMKTKVINKYATAGNVSTPKAIAVLDNLIVNLKAQNLPEQLDTLINQLEGVKTSLSTPGNLNKIEANRSTLFDLKAGTNLANIPKKSEKAFEKVYNALNDDMGEFIKTTGNQKDFTRWKVANKKLAMMSGDLTQGGLKRALNEGDFNPQTVTSMLTSINPQQVKQLYDNLGSAGRANARLLLLQNIAKKSYDPNTNTFNPSTFASEANRLKGSFGQFFSGAEAKRINGLVAVLNATRRAQEAQFAPRTGERAIPFLTAGSFAGLGTLLGFDLFTGAALSAGAGAGARLYETPAIRNLLIRINNASGSERARLVSDVLQRMTAAGAAVAPSNLAGPQEEQPTQPEGEIMESPRQ